MTEAPPARVLSMPDAPDTDAYVRAFEALGSRVSEGQRSLLRAHWTSPGREATARELAAAVGLASHARVNALYGGLGHDLCDQLGVTPTLRRAGTPRWWTVLAKGWREPRGYVWRMLPQVATALERLGWVSDTGPAEFAFPEEIAADRHLVEGAVRQVQVNAYERNPAARRACIAHHGARCVVCSFDFGAMYGATLEGYIHVHHLRPLADIGAEYRVDPIADLRPVCPNCHAVIHHREPPLSIEEVQLLLGTRRRAAPNEQ